MVARVKANLSQYQRLTGKRPAPSEIILGDVRVNTGTHRVFVENREIELKNKEYELLLYLMLNVDLVFDRETLYEKVWGLDAMGDNATVAVHINRLREKIEKDPSKPRYIETVWGAGYRFKGVSLKAYGLLSQILCLCFFRILFFVSETVILKIRCVSCGRHCCKAVIAVKSSLL